MYYLMIYLIFRWKFEFKDGKKPEREEKRELDENMSLGHFKSSSLLNDNEAKSLSSNQMNSASNYTLHHSSTFPNNQQFINTGSYPTGFIRVKLIELDPAPVYNHIYNHQRAADPDLTVSSSIDPYCAISIKERIHVKANQTGNKNKNNNQHHSKTNSKVGKILISFEKIYYISQFSKRPYCLIAFCKTYMPNPF